MTIFKERSLGAVLKLVRENTPPSETEAAARVGRPGPRCKHGGLTLKEAARRAGYDDDHHSAWQKREGAGCQTRRAGELLSALRGERWTAVIGHGWACAGPDEEIKSRLYEARKPPETT